MRTSLKVGVGLCLAFLLAFSFYAGAVIQHDEDQLWLYDQAKTHDVHFTPVLPLNSSCSGCTILDHVGFMISLTAEIFNPHDVIADQKLISEGYIPDCLSLCLGIHYWQDPTTVMTNTGHDFFQFKFTGQCPSAITCTSADVVNYMMISTSSSVPAVTDTGCGGSTGSGQITTGGLADVSVTPTVGNAAAGSSTTTWSHTWTAAETDTNIQNLCLNTEGHAGANVILVISGTFGPDTLHSGDTFTGTVQLIAT